MTTTDELRTALGRIGIWMPPPAPIGLDPGSYAREIEDAGFGSLWIPRVDDPESLDALEPLLAATTRLIVGTGIANIWMWAPDDLAGRADRLTAAYPGRFVLGLGVSHAPRVESSGQAYVQPYAKMVGFLDELPDPRTPLVLAALGPRMLALSRDRSVGAHPYFSPPEHTAYARSVLGPGPVLIPEIAVALAPGDDGEVAAKAYARRYLALPNYTNNLRRFGFVDADLADGGSRRMLSSVVPNGPGDSATRILEHLQAGADHLLIQLVTEDGRFASGDLGQLASLVADQLA